MSEFEKVLKLAELPEGTATRIELDGAEVCVVHTDGQVFAIDDVCSHAEVSLSEGEGEEATIHVAPTQGAQRT